MEPVIFPKAIAPVRQTDRVKRAKPREDSGDGSKFARHLREQQENPSGPPDGQSEATGQSAESAVGEPSEEGAQVPRPPGGDDEAFKKLIEIRV